MDGALLRLDVDIEEVRTRLGALFAPRGVTRPFRPILRRIREAAREVGDPSLEAAGLAILSEWEVRAAASAHARAGVASVIEALAARGDRLGLVTDNGGACVAPALAAAGLPAVFASIGTRDDAPSGKGAALARVLSALGDGETWYVIDHASEAELGRAAGIHVAAFAGGGGAATESDLRRAGAERILGSAAEVLELGTRT